MQDLSPAALRSASLYQVFPRNFTREGTLGAAAARLAGIAGMGFDYVYLTPIHPIGKARRKGRAGSPYAIADYRRIDPELGGETEFRFFIDEAHRLGLGVIMDVVYNHTSPDSVLAREHPEWFWKGGAGGSDAGRSAAGESAPRIAEWSDVVDLDYSQRELWDYQIETLESWARFGADGFRCDVATLVPVDFWIEARRRLASVKPVLWLAESMHKEFVIYCRRRGIAMWSDPELCAAFDLTYDYDGREELESAWRGQSSLGYYLKMLEVQESLYPERAVKLRFLENHDQPRAAWRFGRGARLRSWTLFSMLLPGAFLAYMGEETAMEKRIGLFDRETMKEDEGDPSFKDFFAPALALSRRIKAEAPVFEAKLLAEGVVLIERHGVKRSFVAILNLDGRSGKLELPLQRTQSWIALLGDDSSLSGSSLGLGPEPLVFERKLLEPC